MKTSMTENASPGLPAKTDSMSTIDSRDSDLTQDSSGQHEDDLDVSVVSRLKESRYSLLKSVIRSSDDSEFSSSQGVDKTELEHVIDAVCEEDDEWDRAKNYFLTHPEEVKLRRTRDEDEGDEASEFLHSYIKTIDLNTSAAMVYQLSNKQEQRDYQARYGHTGQGARSSVKYASDEASNVYIMKITTEKSTVESKVFTEANVQSSATVSRSSTSEKPMMHESDVKFYTPIKCLGKNLTAYLEQHPKLTLEQQYLLAIKISLTVYQFHQGERAGVPRAHLDLKPENIVISGDFDRNSAGNNIQVHLIDFESVSEDLSAVTKDRNGSKVYMPPESIELDNLSCDVFALMRTFFLDKEFYRFQALEDDTKYKRRPGDVYLFKAAEELYESCENLFLEKAKIVLSTGQEKADMKNNIPNRSLDLALGLALAKLELTTKENIREICGQYISKPELYKQAVINLVIAGVDINFAYLDSLESQLDFQLAIVALGKINQQLLTLENISAISQSDNKFSFLFSLELAQAGEYFIVESLDEGLLEKSILLLAHGKINNFQAWQRVLNQDINFQWALLLLARFESELIELEIINGLLINNENPIEFVAEFLLSHCKAKPVKDVLVTFQDFVTCLDSKNISSDHAIWLELAKNNQEMQTSIRALSKESESLFQRCINTLLEKPKLQELVAEPENIDDNVVRARDIIHMVNCSNIILEALACLDLFSFVNTDKQDVISACISKNPREKLGKILGQLLQSIQNSKKHEDGVSGYLEKHIKHTSPQLVNIAARALTRQGMFASFPHVPTPYQRSFAETIFDSLCNNPSISMKTVVLQTMRVFICAGWLKSRQTLSCDLNLHFNLAVKLVGISLQDIENALRAEKPSNDVKTVGKLTRLYWRERSDQLSNSSSLTLARL